MSAQSFSTLTPIPSPIMGEGRNDSITPFSQTWEKGLGDEGYQGFCQFGMLPSNLA
jgi:hypothetical protein